MPSEHLEGYSILKSLINRDMPIKIPVSEIALRTVMKRTEKKVLVEDVEQVQPLGTIGGNVK